MKYILFLLLFIFILLIGSSVLSFYNSQKSYYNDLEKLSNVYSTFRYEFKCFAVQGRVIKLLLYISDSAEEIKTECEQAEAEAERQRKEIREWCETNTEQKSWTDYNMCQTISDEA